MTSASAVKAIRVNPSTLLAVAVALLVSGCVGGGSSKNGGVSGPDVDLGGDAVVIRGIVVDDELLPIFEAAITDGATQTTFLTNELGEFVIGPVAEGQHDLGVSKSGYTTAAQTVQVYSESVDGIRFTLSALATTVPYHESIPHTTFVNCASFNPIGGVPCTALPDFIIGGHTVSPEESFSFRWKVPAPNLADLLIEMTWNVQQFGHDASFWIQTPPGQPLTAATVKYFRMEGGPPLRGWVIANANNTGEDGPTFDAEPGKVEYEGVTGWSGENSTIPGIKEGTIPSNPVYDGGLSGTSLYFNHRTDVWMTFFYNRPGSRDFSAVPDQ